MAILEDLGLEVKILVNESPLPEYEDKEADPTDDGFGDEIRKCRCYVEVVDNAEFVVQLHVTPANNYLNNTKKRFRFALDLDDQEEFEDRLMDSTEQVILIDGKDEYDGQKSTLRKFRFTAVSTVDDDDTERVNNDKTTAKHVGLLRVRVWRVKIDGSAPSSPCQTAGMDEIETKLAEKALKGKSLSHRATLSAPVPTADSDCWSLKYVDPFKVPLAIFYFKYRSRAALQEELVIPHSREPSPQPVDLDALPLREVHRLARQSVDILPLHEIRRLAQLRLLSSNGGGNTSSEGAVKREPGVDQMSQRPRKFVKMSDGREAVDLTDDD